MKKISSPKELLKLNIVITLFIILANIAIFLYTKGSKDYYTYLSLYLNGFILFIYLILFSDKVKNNISELKKEVLYINYPLSIAFFLAFILFILIASAIFLVIINKDAANVTFIFTFFMSTISMLFPSIVLGVFIYFIVPALIVPGLNLRQKKNSKLKYFIIFLFIIYIIFCAYKGFNEITKISNIQNQDKYKSSKLPISYSTEFLKINNVSPYAKKKMSRDEVKIPFFYTSESIPQEEYYEAENFCSSMDAKVPNYLEIYHIIFNKFDTFGEKYYWTSDKDGKYPLVLHFKNMSYEIIRKPEKVTPSVYCIAKNTSNYGFNNKLFFYRNVKKEQAANLKDMMNKPFDVDKLKEFAGIETKQTSSFELPKKDIINTEKKHVNFSVKEVTPEVLNELIQKGYNYNPSIMINSQYETEESRLNSAVQKNTDKIRLCYYPFEEYDNMTITQESQIWKQSFCSPAFDLVNQTPVMKTRYDKEAYCMANGGRVPNIPELNGILKTLGVNYIGKKYWINTRISDPNSNTQRPVYVEYKDSRFMQIKSLGSGENENAYVYCIKKPQYPSRVIANYKSRFKGEEGLYYAKEKCPSCQYYEVPDTILQR